MDTNSIKIKQKFDITSILLMGFFECYNMDETQKESRIKEIEKIFKFSPKPDDVLLYLILGELRDNLESFKLP